jgi:hypothetical protein
MQPFWKNSLHKIDIDMRKIIYNDLDIIISFLENIAMRETIKNIVIIYLLEIMKASDEIRYSFLIPGSNMNNFIQYYFNIIRVKIVNDKDKVSEGKRDKHNVIWIALMFRMIC